MGNSASNTQVKDGYRGHAESSSRISPSPALKLRHKKGSLQLPDLQYTVPARQPIAIPNRGADRPKARTPQAIEQWQSMAAMATPDSYASPHPPPPVPPSSVESNGIEYTEIVRSTLPLPLAVADTLPDSAADEVETPIVWNGAANKVFLVRCIDEGEEFVAMERDGERFIVKIKLPHGTHHLRFLVDDQSLVSDNMPKAVDEQGALANYISVGLGSSLPPVLRVAPMPRANSFWSTSTGNNPDSPSLPCPEWTSTIPLELTEAAAQEAAFIASYTANTTTIGRRQILEGFNVASGPSLPPAPMLPRHLEKQILNTNSSSSSSSSKDKRRGKHGHGHRGDRTPERSAGIPRVLPVTTASGTDISSFAALGPLTAKAPSACVPVLQDDTVIADDNSILMVPSHVVLNHLCTSNIRNGVLAVADTVRYKNKFVTTIYYKPT